MSAIIQQQMNSVQNLYNQGKMPQAQYDSRMTALRSAYNQQLAAEQAKAAQSNANQANNSSNANSNLVQSPSSTNNNSVSPMPAEYWNPTTSNPGVVTGVTPGIGTNVGTYNVSSDSTTGQRLMENLTAMRSEAAYELQHGQISRDEYDQKIAEVERQEQNRANPPGTTAPLQDPYKDAAKAYEIIVQEQTNQKQAEYKIDEKTGQGYYVLPDGSIFNMAESKSNEQDANTFIKNCVCGLVFG
jgi:hypothetical protein